MLFRSRRGFIHSLSCLTNKTRSFRSVLVPPFLGKHWTSQSHSSESQSTNKLGWFSCVRSPSPVYSSNDSLAYALEFRDVVPSLRLAAMHFPPFHSVGVMVQIMLALRTCITVALYPPVTKRPELLPIMPTPENVLDHLQRTKSNGIVTIPSNLQIWSHDPKCIDILKGLIFVVRRFGLLPFLVLKLEGIFHCFLVCRFIVAERSLKKLATCYILLE